MKGGKEGRREADRWGNLLDPRMILTYVLVYEINTDKDDSNTNDFRL